MSTFWLLFSLLKRKKYMVNRFCLFNILICEKVFCVYGPPMNDINHLLRCPLVTHFNKLTYGVMISPSPSGWRHLLMALDSLHCFMFYIFHSVDPYLSTAALFKKAPISFPSFFLLGKMDTFSVCHWERNKKCIWEELPLHLYM